MELKKYPKVTGEISFVFNGRAAIEAVLCVLQHNGGKINLYNLQKVIFAAEKYHLNKHARTVIGDFYVRETNGVVPIVLTDTLLGGNRKACLEDLDELPLQLTKTGDDYLVTGTREPDLGYLSESDVDALKFGVKEYANLSRDQVKRKNHKEKCWRETPDNHAIPFELMITDPEILEELEEHPYGIGV